MLLVFVLARKRRLDRVTVRAVAERRPPERSGVDERRAAYQIPGMLIEASLLGVLLLRNESIVGWTLQRS
jgi:hypothetical protein